jgi:dTDP-4-dehydrorhamnose reductase
MLGNAVTSYFQSNPQYEVTTTYRNINVMLPGNALKFDTLSNSLDDLPNRFDYVINCIGVIKPFMAADPLAAVRINSAFPWILADWCEKHQIKLFHITTDCVYSGSKGKYIETDLHDALDDYGKSKSLGECVSKAMVIRTSIIGEEIHKDASLIAWAKKQKGQVVGGFSTHLWNGITTKQYAVVCDKIINNKWYQKGLFHVFAKDDVSKLEMMYMFNEKYDLGLTIEEKTPPPVDRTLRTEKDLCGMLDMPTVKQMIKEI